MEPKPWYASKTLWANLIGGAVTVGGVFGLDLGLDEAAQAQLVAGIMVAINIVLRLVTKAPIGKPGKPGGSGTIMLLACLALVGCAAVGAPSPETPRERYAATEAGYQAVVRTVDGLIDQGAIVPGSDVALSVRNAMLATNSALAVWVTSPDNLTYQQTAIAALTALQAVVAEIRRGVRAGVYLTTGASP